MLASVFSIMQSLRQNEADELLHETDSLAI